jgi:putative flippase GtrA
MVTSPSVDTENLAGSKRTSLIQILTFGVIGVFNTALDFAIFNFLSFVVAFPLIMSNIISVSIAMLVSYVLNSYFTFSNQQSRKSIKQFLLFFFITAIGIYVIQNFIIYLFSDLWIHPAKMTLKFIENVTSSTINSVIFNANFSKVLAVGFAMVWNFSLYKFVVFKR